MTEQTDQIALKKLWFDHNMFGDGKEKHQIGKFRYDQSVFYIETTPSQRLLPAANGKWALLCRYGGAMVPEGRGERTAVVIVPDIAVFSTYSGDWYDDPDEIHARQKYIMLMRTNMLLEECDRCIAKQFESASFVNSYQGTMRSYYNQWQSYDNVFQLGWGALSQHYQNQLTQIIANKKLQWNDPRAVTKRERAMARKKAKEALGLI